MNKRLWTVAAVVAGGVWFGASAWAMGPNGTCPTGPGGGTQPPMMTLTNLDAELQLSEAQRGAWDEFVTTVNARRSEMMGSMMAQRNAGASSGPAYDNLRNNAQLMEKRMTMMRTMADALEQLYTKLTPEQQAVIDRTIAGHEGHGG